MTWLSSELSRFPETQNRSRDIPISANISSFLITPACNGSCKTVTEGLCLEAKVKGYVEFNDNINQKAYIVNFNIIDLIIN